MAALATGTGWGLTVAVAIAGALVGAVASGLLTARLARENDRRERALEKATAAEQTARLDRRLEEVNRMTGGLAHEIKNPLSTIGLNVQLLREDLADIAKGQDADSAEPDAALERLRRRLDGVHRETTRLRDILDDFLRFAGRIRLDLGKVSLDEAIEELVDFFTPEAASKGIRLQADLRVGLAPLVADAGLLKQALLNLLMNAVQAMAADGGGAAAPASGVRGDLVVRARAAARGGRAGVTVDVIDTGPGIPENRLEKVFEPYHTTRRGGTGLGLPTSRRIVELHGGTLLVESEVGKGTCFSLWLPAAGPGNPQGAAASS